MPSASVYTSSRVSFGGSAGKDQPRAKGQIPAATNSSVRLRIENLREAEATTAMQNLTLSSSVPSGEVMGQASSPDDLSVLSSPTFK